MERERLDDLWSRFLAGQELTPREEAELEEAVTNDPRLRAELLADLRLDQSLRGAGRVDRDGDAFTDAFRYRLKTERDGTRFVDKVRLNVRRARKPPTRRWGAGSSTGVRIAVAAALLLLALGPLLVRSLQRRPPSPAARNEPREVEPPPRAPAPAALPDPLPRERLPLPEPPRPPAPLPATAPVEPSPKEAPSAEPKPAPPRPPETRVAETPAPPPAAVFASVTRVQGDVFLSAPRAPVRAGQKLLSGQGLETGARSGLAFLCPDGTRVEMAADTAVRDLSEAKGKRLTLARGTLSADVVRQPADQPLVVSTPHGEARVLGTSFRISVEPAQTRLDVKEGKVRLTRVPDGRSVEVPAGCFALAGPSLEPELNAEHRVTVSFQDGQLPTPKYAGTSDALIHENPRQADRNFGTANALWVDGSTTDSGDDRAILLRWDLSAIPPRSFVLSASIDVHVSNDSRGTAFELYELKRDWTEGGVTWKSAGPKLPWQAPGAQGPLDRGSAAVGVLSPRAAGPQSFRLPPEGVALVQAWIDHPATNRGFIIANPDNQDAVGFASREAAAPTQRPKLTIHFLPRGAARPK